MNEEETLLIVAEEEGTQLWLDDALQSNGRLEKVSRSDLGRVVRLLEATNAAVVLVEVVDQDINQSMAIITALSSARPWITVMAVCRLADQELLLQCMRAGARDCVVVGSDATDLRDRLRRHQLVRPGHVGEKLESRTRNLILVAGASPQVDTAFLAQNIAVAMAGERRVLAIDVAGNNEQIFHLDSSSHYDLAQLLVSSDTLDHALLDTALEEFRHGLRLLAGGPNMDFLGDQGADLFIALSRLMGMFDQIVLNVGSDNQSAWIKSIGVHVGHLVVAAHPEVAQLRKVREHLANWRPHLSKEGESHLVLDGYESSLPPTLQEVEENTGCDAVVALPMEWRQRLESINLGLPISESAPRSAYNRKLNSLISQLTNDSVPAFGGNNKSSLLGKLVPGQKA